MSAGTADFVASLVKYGLMFGIFINVAPIMNWVERRACAYIQDRPGPNRLGPLGLFQPLADAFKFMFKEDVTPALADKPLYLLAPVLALLPAFTTFVVIPFGPDLVVNGRTVPLVVANVATGVLLFLAISSLGVYSLVMAGYASNNKFSLLGAVRASAQLISYELALTLAVLAVLIPAGSFRLARHRRLSAEPPLELHPPVHRLRGLPDRLVRGDQPPAVRPAGGGVGAGGRVPHRVRRDALRPLLPGRVHQHGGAVGAGRDALLRRLDPAVRPACRSSSSTPGWGRPSASPRCSPRSASAWPSSSGSAGRSRGSATTS